MKHYKRLTWYNRIQIETLYNSGTSVKEIARILGKHISSIYDELNSGFYMHRNHDWTETKKYSATIAHDRMLFNRTTKGAHLKIDHDYDFLKYIENKIKKDKMSPDAILGEIKRKGLKFKTTICRTTLYSYVYKGIFLHVTAKDLLMQGKRKSKKKRDKNVVIKRVSRGKSIETRPLSALDRKEFGHWEFDTVIGKKTTRQVLYVLTERKTRKEIIIKGKDKTALTAVGIIDKLECIYKDNFPKVFKTITCDNGVEFSQYEAMERSILYRGYRTQVYFCHPYASSERGSNENQNGFIRRFIKKGTPIEQYTSTYINDVQEYINNYPRKIFDYHTANEQFMLEMAKIDKSQKFF